MSERDSIRFEKLTAEIFDILRNNPVYETVEHNVELEGKDGPRQIDVLLKGKIGPIDIVTIVECKDIKRNLDVGYIDAVHSKMQDVNAQKAVLVARKGFSNHAIKKANRLKISLCTVHQSKSEKWTIPLEIPVFIDEITPIINPKFTISTHGSGSLFFSTIINGVNIFDEFTGKWNKGLIPITANNDELEWSSSEISEPYFMINDDGQKLEISKMAFKYSIKHKYYFGYANELEDSRIINFITEENTNILLNQEELLKYKEKFQIYESVESLPKINYPPIQFHAIPEMQKGISGRLTVTRIK